MPIRHEGDLRRKPIKSWDSWVDEAILEAQERGDFDNLPLHGKPIKIEDSPFAPDMAPALRMLKNAGYAPTWMELDREISHGRQEMREFLSRSAAWLRAKAYEIATAKPESPAGSVAPPSVWVQIKRWLSIGREVDYPAPRTLTPDDLVQIRSRMRVQYLGRAAAIDKKVTQFHAALPRNLWHLERVRLTQELAAKTFDRECPAPGGFVGTDLNQPT